MHGLIQGLGLEGYDVTKGVTYKNGQALCAGFIYTTHKFYNGTGA